MKQWKNIVALSVVVAAGCGGGGAGSSSSTGKGGGTTTPPVTGPTISWPGQTGLGQIELMFLTGAGRTQVRSSTDTLSVSFGLTEFIDQSNTPFVLNSTPLVGLTNYLDNMFEINVPADQANSTPISNFQFSVQELDDTVPLDPLSPYIVPAASITLNNPNVPAVTPALSEVQISVAGMHVFPGRYTQVPVLIDNSMFTVTTGGAPSATFNIAQFAAQNGLTPGSTTNTINQLTGNMRSFLSDYLAFNISGMASKPSLISNGAPAGRVFFSGDGYALSDTGAVRGTFEFLSQNVGTQKNYDGAWSLNGATGLIPGSATQVKTPGTYSITQASPVANAAPITAVEGIWHDYTDVISNMGASLALTMPHSADDNRQDIIFVAQTQNADKSFTITNLYYGLVDFDSNTFRAYPIQDIVTASVAGELDGTITQRLGSGGATTLSYPGTRSGSYAFTAGAPAGIPSTGTFIVYRQ